MDSYLKVCNQINKLKGKPQKEALLAAISLNALLTKTPQHQAFSYYEKKALRKIRLLYDASSSCLSQYSQVSQNLFKEGLFKVPKPPYEPCDFILSEVLQKGSGHPISLSLLFLYFSRHFPCSLFLLPLAPQAYIFKLIDQKNSCHYFDLQKQGQVLPREELPSFSSSLSPSLQTLDAYKVLLLFIEQYIRILKEKELFQQVHILLSIMCELEPLQHHFLAERALVRRKLGLINLALEDLKTFFSFNNKSEAPKELKVAFYELQTLCQFKDKMTPPV
ncbi:MAG: hypothetical protein D6797_02745 [Bdellovibrio sp.]|nr:MAG: hypothetical protein D6797_02745 [Bdellovibrio sp.]